MRSYYAFRDKKGIQSCSRASDAYPLMVNCAGNMETTFPLSTDIADGREDYYLLYLVEGEMTVHLPEGERTVTEGTFLLFPPHYRYRYSYHSPKPLSYFWVHFTGSYAARLLEECGLTPLPLCHCAVGDPRIPARFRSLFDRLVIPEPFLTKELSCALEQLLLTVGEVLHASPVARTLERSLGVIHASYQKELRIPDLARMENLSQSRYHTLFRELTGVSPAAYIIDLRLQSACDLLRSTDMSIKQIALQVGYDDPFFFSKLFKRHMGISPQSYRNTP